MWKSEFLTEFRKIVEKAGPENLALLDEGFVPKPSTLDSVTLAMMAPQSSPAGTSPPDGVLYLQPSQEYLRTTPGTTGCSRRIGTQ